MSKRSLGTEAIFAKALELDGDDRTAFLREACGDDEDLLRRVERLLRAHERRTDFLPEDVSVDDERVESSDDDPNRSVGELVGTTIGRYKLLERLAEGGFGVVYVAQQDEPVQRRVALKLIKPGMDTKDVIARFEAERQALALMDHPNVARVIDAGATDQGRPYFVMELVHGVKITEYCDQNCLSTRERLELFSDICQAVQHAHQKGIIHRDLKPSNILVTLHDGKPVPKVIDFGVAKALSHRLTEKTVYTSYGQMIGTPEYMSPEQAEMSGLGIDTRSDIYSLGVLLYELLTGQPPFDGKRLRSSGYEAMMKIIREEEPPRPSAKLSTLGKEATVVAQYRSTDVSKLGQNLRGELDWIAMKALEKDRNRRYETAHGLAADIWRFLADEAVKACPPSTLYRLRKFARRNRSLVVSTVMLLVMLSLGLVGTSLGLASARRERDKAKELAERNAELVESEKTARLSAEAAQRTTEKEQQRADAERVAATRHAYAARMNLLQQAWEQADLPRVRNLLDETSSHSERGFEWYYWQKQVRLDSRTMRGHRGRVDAVVYSSDGLRVFTGGGDGIVRVWDSNTGVQLRRLPGHTGLIFCLSLAPDGKRLYSASWDSTVKIWDTESGGLLHTLANHDASIRTVANSHQGTLATADSEDVVIVWDARNSSEPPKEIWRLTETGPAVDISPDGRRLVTCNFQKRTMQLWDVAKRRRLLDFSIKSNAGRARFTPDGQRIVSTHVDRSVVLWDVDGTQIHSAVAHVSGFITSPQFSPDGKLFATGGDDHTVRIWDAATGREIRTLKGHLGWVRGIAFAPDGQHLASVSHDETVKIWDVSKRQDLRSIEGRRGQIRCVAYSPDDERVALGGEDRTVAIVNLVAGREEMRLTGHKDWVSAAAFSSNGQSLATGSDDGTAMLWNIEGEHQATFLGHEDRVSAVAFSPDAKRLVTGGWDNQALVWDIESRTILARLVGHAGPVWAVSFSPDGRLILTGSEDHSARLWDASTGIELSQLDGHEGPVRSVDFFSGMTGQLTAATGSVDATIRTWTVTPNTDSVVGNVLEGHSGPVWSVEYTDLGRRIVSAGDDGTIRIWDCDGGQHLLAIDTQPGTILSAHLAADGNALLGGFANSTIKVWEAISARELADRQEQDRIELARLQANAQETISQLQSSVSPIGAVREWLLLAPIRPSTTATDNATMRSVIQERFIPEEQISGGGAETLLPRTGEPIKIQDRELVWRPAQLDDFIIAFDSLLGEGTYWPSCVAYAACYIYADEKRTVEMKIGWDDYARVFLNGRLIFDSPATAFAVDAKTLSGIQLNPGRNVLLVKIANGIGPWRGSVRFTDSAGNPADLNLSLNPDEMILR